MIQRKQIWWEQNGPSEKWKRYKEKHRSIKTVLKNAQKPTSAATRLQSDRAFFTVPTLSLHYSALSSGLRKPVLLAVATDYQSAHNSLPKLSSD